MKFSDHLAMLYGDGGNVAIVTSPDGLMMIDGGFPSAPPICSKPFPNKWTRIPFASFSTPTGTLITSDAMKCWAVPAQKIIAQENVKKRLSVKTTMESLNRTFDPLNPKAFPRRLSLKAAG